MNLTRSATALALSATFAISTSAAWASPEDCAKCHQPAEFSGMSPADLREALSDPGVPPHRKFTELTDAQLAEIIAAAEK